MGHSIRSHSTNPTPNATAGQGPAEPSAMRPDGATDGATSRWERCFLETGAFGGRLAGHTPADMPVDPAAQERAAERVIKWLASNRVESRLEEGTGTVVVMGGVASIDPPYTKHSCRSSNEIVLARVQQLVQAVPSEA